MAESSDLEFTEILGPKRFLTWTVENPMWWVLHRTTNAGHFDVEDAKEFNQCTGKFLVFFDHTKEADARLLAIKILDRIDRFKSAKVSKFAVDGEKILVFLAKDGKLKNRIESACNVFGFKLYGFVGKNAAKTKQEIEMSKKWDEYLTCLANAFKPMTEHRGPEITSIESTPL